LYPLMEGEVVDHGLVVRSVRTIGWEERYSED